MKKPGHHETRVTQWTWFLPNPLWPPNKIKWNFVNRFRFGLNGFNAKTRREN